MNRRFFVITVLKKAIIAKRNYHINHNIILLQYINILPILQIACEKSNLNKLPKKYMVGEKNRFYFHRNEKKLHILRLVYVT